MFYPSFSDLQEQRTFSVADLHVSFTDSLVSKLQENPPFGKKSLNALRYGFVGVSRGGKSGITVITESDKRIWEQFQRFLDSPEYDSLLEQEGLGEVIGVKIVAHIPSGDRVLGLYDSLQKRVLFYDQGRY